MVSRKIIHSGSNVARPNKVRAAHLPLRMTVKSQLGRKKEVFIAEWNVRTLMDTVTSSRPERQTALIAKELSRYSVDIADSVKLGWHATTVWLIVDTHFLEWQN